jgi:acyl carrier protein
MNRAQIQHEIILLLSNECGLPDNTTAEVLLFTSGLLDSPEIVRILPLIEERFGIRVGAFDVNLDNFDSVKQITEFVAARLGCQG